MKLLITICSIILTTATLLSEEPTTPATNDVQAYAFGYGGGSFGFSLGAPFFSDNESFELDSGYIVGGGLGIRTNLFNGSRFEIEGIYANHDLQSISTTSGGLLFFPFSVGFEGELTTKAIMFNALKEFAIGEQIKLFGGGGLGFVELEEHRVETSDFFFFPSPSQFSQTVSTVKASYQLMAGAEYDFSNKTSLFVQYKYLTFENVPTLFSSEQEDFNLHSVSAGLRFSF